MNTLEINEEKAARFNKLEDTAIDIVQEYFDGKHQGGDDVKMAGQMINAMKGNRQTATVRDALKFNMVRALTDDPKAMKRYVESTQPGIKKIITGKK